MDLQDKLTEIEYQAIDIKMQFDILFDVIRYNDDNQEVFSSMQFLCEMLEENFSVLMKLF